VVSTLRIKMSLSNGTSLVDWHLPFRKNVVVSSFRVNMSPSDAASLAGWCPTFRKNVVVSSLCVSMSPSAVASLGDWRPTFRKNVVVSFLRVKMSPSDARPHLEEWRPQLHLKCERQIQNRTFYFMDYFLSFQTSAFALYLQNSVDVPWPSDCIELYYRKYISVEKEFYR
jgi:hypothetical protein